MADGDGEACVFCEIATANPPNTTAPAPDVLLANEHVLAFLDIQPLVSSHAHVLVVPRKHYATLDELAEDAEAARELGLWLPRVARAALAATGGSAFNIVQNNGARAGQIVPHVHFHVVIRDPADPHGSTVAALVDKAKDAFRLLDRITFGAQVFGRGQRTDLASPALAARLRSLL